MSWYLDTDPYSGAVETFDYDENTDTVIIKRTCDVQPVIDFNKETANHTDGWIGDGRDLRRAARIPMEVALKWYVEEGIRCWRKEDWPAVRKKLNSIEYRDLRSNHFRL